MKEYYILLTVRFVAAVALAVILGSGSVVAFNHMPAVWFRDDGKLPEDIDQRQRITSSVEICFYRSIRSLRPVHGCQGHSAI